MMRFIMLLTLSVITFQLPELQAQATIGGEWRTDIEHRARQISDQGMVPGFGVAVTYKDWVIYTGGFGVTDVRTGNPVTSDTRYYIASSTKALTATAVMQLSERGLLALDAPVTRYLPDLRFREPLDAGSISVSDLLTMTEGIEEKSPVVFRTAFSGDFTTDQLIELLRDYGPADTGRQFDYSNLPYNLLGLIMGTVAADSLQAGSWKTVVEREVLDPLGMQHTTAYRSDLDEAEIAMPHELGADSKYNRTRLAKDDANLHAAGGHFATAADLARFVAAHASGGMLNGKRIFSGTSITWMHEQQTGQDRDFGPYRRYGWGYGWDLARWEGKQLVQRFGGFSGYYSHMSFMPEHEIGVVVLTNGSAQSVAFADHLATYIYDRLLGTPNLEEKYQKRLQRLREHIPVQAERRKQHLAKRRHRLAPLPRPLDDYAGTYENPKMGRVTWRTVAGGLEVRMGVAQDRAEIYHAQNNQLRIALTGRGQVAEFRFQRENRPASSVTVGDYTYRRVE